MLTKPEVITKPTLNFLDVARWISEQEGYLISNDRDSWHHQLMTALEVRSNDCYITFNFCEEDEVEECFDPDDIIWQFYKALQKYYGFKADDAILLHISW